MKIKSRLHQTLQALFITGISIVIFATSCAPDGDKVTSKKEAHDEKVAYGDGVTYEPVPEAIMVPDSVDTYAGKLEYINGFPTKETSEIAIDELLKGRTMDAFISALPIAALYSAKEGLKSIGQTENHYLVIYDELLDSRPIWLTGNTNTVYVFSILDLKKGPVVIEVPAGSGPALLNDASFEYVADFGPVGADQGKGGSYVVLPPDYEGELTPSGTKLVDVKMGSKTTQAYVIQSKSYLHWLGFRGFMKDGSPKHASEMFRNNLKVYSLADANNPPKMKFISGGGKYLNSVHSNNFEFFSEVKAMIDYEHLDFITPELRGTLASIGIIKGKPFDPDPRTKAIMNDAVQIAVAAARTISFNTKAARTHVDYSIFEGTNWTTPFVNGYDFAKNKNEGLNKDSRAYYYYIAIALTPAMEAKMVGKGSIYAMGYMDDKSEPLEGKKMYTLNIPANIPAKDFAAVTLYDIQTRSQLQNGSRLATINLDKERAINKDGSMDLYFGPVAPTDKNKLKNWMYTPANTSWFVALRLYGPLEPYWDKEWTVKDFEEISQY